MLRVVLNNALDGVNKSFWFAQTAIKKGLEFLLGDGNIGLILYFPQMLLPAKQGGIFEESGGK